MTETIAGSLLFLRLESTAGRKRRGPAKPAPQSIPSPLVRHLVAWVAPSAVLRASAEIVGRRASLIPQLTPKRGAKTPRPKKTAKWPLSTLTDTATPVSAVGATLSAPRVLAVDDAATSGTSPGRCSSGAATPLSQGRLGERQADGLTLRLARRLHRISRRTAPMRHRRSFASRRGAPRRGAARPPGPAPPPRGR